MKVYIFWAFLLLLLIILAANFFLARHAFFTFIRDDIPIFRNTWRTTTPTERISIKLALFIYLFVPFAKWSFSDHADVLEVFKEHITPFLYGLAEALLAVGFIMFILKVNRRHSLLRVFRRR